MQAAAWAVAAALAGRLGPGCQFREAHPAGGQADTLAFADPAGDCPHVYVGLGSSIHISSAERDEIPIDGDVWPGWSPDGCRSGNSQTKLSPARSINWSSERAA